MADSLQSALPCRKATTECEVPLTSAAGIGGGLNRGVRWSWAHASRPWRRHWWRSGPGPGSLAAVVSSASRSGLRGRAGEHALEGFGRDRAPVPGPRCGACRLSGAARQVSGHKHGPPHSRCEFSSSRHLGEQDSRRIGLSIPIDSGRLRSTMKLSEACCVAAVVRQRDLRVGAVRPPTRRRGRDVG